MLTFNVILGSQGLLFRDFLCFFFLDFFFQSDRPTQYQKTHSTLNKQKRGWPNETGISVGRLSLWLMCAYTFLPWITCHSEKLC